MPPDSRAPAAHAATFALRPAEFRDWLGTLPMAQLLDAGRALREALSRIEDAPLEAAARAEMLGLAAPAADQLLAGLNQVYAQAPQPLGPHAVEAVTLARALASSMALGYERAAADLAASSPLLDELPVMLARAMRYIAKGMQASYKSYSRVAPGAWRGLHELYLRSEDAAGPRGTPGDTPADVYCEACLLALTDPYRLMPGEVDRVLRILRALPASALLGRARPESRAGAHFVVPCVEDKPPRSAVLQDEGSDDGQRWLDANPVVESLRAALEELGSGAALANRLLGADALALMAKLTTLWGDPPKRAHRRDAAEGSVAICVGVKPIAQFVAHDASADGEAELRALRQGITMPLRTLPEDEGGRIVPIHEWAVVNLSEGGLKVRRSSRATTAIAVGDVVGIKAAGKALWTIGMARWITGLEDEKTEFGVQFFADAVCAVWIRTGGTGARKLGVLLAGGDEHGHEWVLAPPHTYREGIELELRGEDYRSRVRATALVEGNARFELFAVDPI